MNTINECVVLYTARHEPPTALDGLEIQGKRETEVEPKTEDKSDFYF